MAAIILSFNGMPSRELVEALVDKLITLLDAEDDVSYDMEPDVDLEESDEGEIETWSEWHLRKLHSAPADGDGVQRRHQAGFSREAAFPA